MLLLTTAFCVNQKSSQRGHRVADSCRPDAITLDVMRLVAERFADHFEWFLIVYADAYEWVELSNVSGMILFADGGYLASKPYAAGGSYINKMSDYCKHCRYKVSQKHGAAACPFNYLYWDFLARNRNKLRQHHRMSMMYKIYDRMGDDNKEAIARSSQRFFTMMQNNDMV